MHLMVLVNFKNMLIKMWQTQKLVAYLYSYEVSRKGKYKIKGITWNYIWVKRGEGMAKMFLS